MVHIGYDPTVGIGVFPWSTTLSALPFRRSVLGLASRKVADKGGSRWHAGVKDYVAGDFMA